MLTVQEIVAAFEEGGGEVLESEEQCPGVFYLAYREERDELPIELIVVERDCPHISAAAKSFGLPMRGHAELLIYSYTDPCGGRPVVLYEVYRYLALHRLPIPDGDTLLSSAACFADVYPEYFGPIPAPVVTPRGYMTRCITLANGIFALETDTGARLIAVAGIIWSLELRDTTKELGMEAADLLAGEIPAEVRHLFFSEEDGCLALFELLPGHEELRESAQLDKTALMNAVWKYHPEYAVAHNLRELQGLNDMLGLTLKDVGFKVELNGSADNMVVLSAGAGTEYVKWC